MVNIVEDFLKFEEKFLYSYYRIILQNKYNRKYVSSFINKYIDVRFYNNVIYSKEKNFLNRVNKELLLIAEELIKENKKDTDDIKNIFALFSYVLYFDECIECKSKKEMINILINDENIKLEFSDSIEKELIELINNFDDGKYRFNKLFTFKDFNINCRRIKKNHYYADIDQSVRISEIYSEYAINKAFNSGIVEENKYILLYYMLSYKVLNDVIHTNYEKRYFVNFPINLFNKNKKKSKYLRILDNDMLKEHIIFKFNYKTYLEYGEQINEIISQGYGVSLELDETFDNNFECLVLFTYVFLNEKYEYVDYFDEGYSDINTNFIRIQGGD